MNFLDSIIMGIIQGLTEFLPVSSSGHLALFEKFFNASQESLLFEVGVHFGTVLSILVVYRKTIYSLLKDLLKFLKTKKMNSGCRLLLMIVVSAIPAGIVGIIFKSYIEQAFSSLLIVGICFILTGVLLYWTEKKISGRKEDNFDDFSDLSGLSEINYKKALLVGWAQAFAILPGISRSGSTIAIALSLGISRKSAAMFSFLMSIPVILGATVLQVIGIEQISQGEVYYLIVSIAVSFVFAFVVI